MAAPLRQDARARLRVQARQEQELAERVLAATERLDAATGKRDAVVAAQDSVVAERRGDVADALANYLDQAGVGLERAALILGRERPYLARLLREHRGRRNADQPTPGTTESR